MTVTIKPKQSTVAARVPTTSDLVDREWAVNLADKKIYVRSGGSIIEVANAAGAGAGASLTWSTQAASFAAVKGNGYQISTVSLTATLPASPARGDTLAFMGTDGAATGLIVARNGNPIMGLAEDMTANIAAFSFALVFADATAGWRLA